MPSTGPRTTIGQWIRAQLFTQNLTQRNLATQTGLSPQYISDIVTDRRRPGREALYAISATLDSPSTDYLFALCGYSPPSWEQLSDDELRRRLTLKETPISGTGGRQGAAGHGATGTL